MAADSASSHEQKQWLHILAVPFPAQSHMSVMMQLCRRLAADPKFHVAISFVNVDSIHEQMVKYWIPPKGLDIRLESIPFDWKIPKGFDAYCVARNGVFAEMAEQQIVPELLDLAARLANQTAPVSCIISDYFLPWTQQVADRLRIDRIALWSGNASWACIECHIPQLVAKNHIFSSQDAEDCLIDYIGGLSPIRRSDLPLYLQKWNDQLWKQHGIKRSKGIDRASRALVNSFYSLEPQAFDFMRDRLGEKVVPIGPLFLLDSQPENVILRPEDADCLTWLDSRKNKKSVLYVSFGSIAVLTKQQFWELAAALESCGSSFLWVVRPELVIDQEEGEDHHLFDSFVERNKNKGLLVSWAPQLQVLKHPAVGGFLTHCGWNSMLESIANGVPMVGWPWAGEQNTNCKIMVEDWKIGAGLSSSSGGGVIQRDEIVRAIKTAMEDESMRIRVESLKSDCAGEAVKQANRNAEALIEEVAAAAAAST